MWTPILDGTLRESAEDSISAIVSELSVDNPDKLTVFEACELAVLFGYLYKHFADRGFQNRCIEYLEVSIEKASLALPQHTGLFGGLCNVGWAIEHVIKLLGEKFDDLEDPLADLDQHIRNLSVPFPLFDLISGHTGLGVYWLERLPRKSAEAGIQSVIEILSASSIMQSSGVTWFTPTQLVPLQQREHAPDGYYNLGVAHGVPGVIGLLAFVSAADISVSAKAREMFDDSLRWLLAHERPRSCASHFGSWLVPGQEQHDSRLAWCYGDLGIGAVLFASGLALGNHDLTAKGREFVDDCLVRRFDGRKVVDTPLCHGAFGAAHILNRIFQSSRIDSYGERARDWYKTGLEMRKPSFGIAGYYAFRPDLEPNERPDKSLLSGAVGVALALLSAIGCQCPEWDRILLLSGTSTVFEAPSRVEVLAV